MKEFRFVILGAGNIAGKFCEAVSLTEHAAVAAVASKSLERAAAFAEKNGVLKAYGDYEEMLRMEKPDGAYIAVTPNDHYRLSMLCLKYGVPVLCEKAMFQNSREAKEVFTASKEKGIFVMEALWSRFLPAVCKVGEWLDEGRIGKAKLASCTIGFRADPDPKRRYYSPELGGGASKDITVYAYEITTYLLRQKLKNLTVSAVWSESGVDESSLVTLEFEETLASLMTTFAADTDERLVIYGSKGHIELPYPHYASEALLYGEKGELLEHFRDEETKNGFTYEIAEMIRCIRDGRTESPVVPHSTTLACAELFDRIDATRPEERDASHF